MTASDVDNIVHAAAAATAPTTAVIAVVDRAGNILALFHKPDAPVTVTGNFSVQLSADDVSIGLARTGAFFSNNQAPLTNRTGHSSSALTCTLKFPVTVTGASGLWNSASNISRPVDHRNDRRGGSRGRRRGVHNIVHVAGR